MQPNSFGTLFHVTTFGESHGPAVGTVIDGVPPNLPLDMDDIQAELDRRRPGRSAMTSPRQERDRVEVLSGLFEGRTTGMPLCLLIRNEDARPGAYEAIKSQYRPGHADYTVERKYGIRDWRGGGRLSGRETAARVAAGAVAKQLLARQGLVVGAAVANIGSAGADLDPWRRAFEEDPPAAAALVEASPVRCPDEKASRIMEQIVLDAKNDQDSIGGIVEARAVGVPVGLGDPVFGKLDALLAWAMMSIGAVKGVEIGDGFALAALRGSSANDPIGPQGLMTNRCGGTLGGISTGSTLVVRLAVKPTPSIAKPQRTIDDQGRVGEIRVTGRHDPCLCPRVVPVAEAMAAMVLIDAQLRKDRASEQI
ncbi:MAG: chorismate synthase [Deltaproteobacteria bacterium]|nr:chorismate synthase [Deltaproteobacteria bacterium]